MMRAWGWMVAVGSLAWMGCPHHGDAESTGEGTVSLHGTMADGGTGSWIIQAPPGDFYLELLGDSDGCDFRCNAANPPLSQRNEDANARRIQLLLRLPVREIPELLDGGTQTLAAHAGMFAATESTVVLHVGKDRSWYSVAGTVQVPALPPPGESMTITLNGIEMSGIDQEPAMRVDGTVEGIYTGARGETARCSGR